MGYGDDLMATGEIKELRKIYPDSKFIVGDGVKYYWSEIFENNPHIIKGNNLKKYRDVKWVHNYLGNRPYRKYKTEQEKNRYVWNNEYSAKIGEIFLLSRKIKFPQRLLMKLRKNLRKKKLYI